MKIGVYSFICAFFIIFGTNIKILLCKKDVFLLLLLEYNSILYCRAN